MYTLQNKHLTLTVDSQHGGKVTSMCYHGRELLASQAHLAPYDPKPGDSFDEAAWGWDDVFPAMNGGTDANHGVVWSTPMQAECDEDIIRLSASILGCSYEKTLSLLPDGIRAEWRIQNMNDTFFEGLWVCHLLWALKENTVFFYPKGYTPVVIDTEETVSALTSIPPAPMWTKYWGQTGSGSFGFEQDGLRVEMRVDNHLLPYLGFWINRGAWPCSDQFAFEPSTGFYDTRERARLSGTLLHLAPGETIFFDMTITIFGKEDLK